MHQNIKYKLSKTIVFICSLEFVRWFASISNYSKQNDFHVTKMTVSARRMKKEQWKKNMNCGENTVDGDRIGENEQVW